MKAEQLPLTPIGPRVHEQHGLQRGRYFDRYIREINGTVYLFIVWRAVMTDARGIVVMRRTADGAPKLVRWFGDKPNGWV